MLRLSSNERNSGMRTTAICVTVGLALAGCGAGDGRTVVVEQMFGNVKVAMDESRPNRLFVTFGDRTGALAYDFNRRADREALVAGMLDEQCGTPTITRTRVTNTGTYSGRPYLVYTLDVECPRGAYRVLD